jgi:hypothetical protein
MLGIHNHNKRRSVDVVAQCVNVTDDLKIISSVFTKVQEEKLEICLIILLVRRVGHRRKLTSVRLRQTIPGV